MAKTASFHPERKRPTVGGEVDEERLWLENTAAIRAFVERRPVYEKLCAEVAYILDRGLANAEIEFSNITYRAKTLPSFLDKIQRKSYRDPINEITDFAGVRVVCLYLDDLPRLETVIRENFEIVEKTDKLTNRNSDQFGYGAIHFTVRLGENASGARYDDLKSLVCEIQTRTVLQDAWAIIDHHLVYKNESNIPSVLRSRLNLLAGNFESADQKFCDLRAERELYLRKVEDSKVDTTQFLGNELNLDSFVRYAQWKFPTLPTGANLVDVPFYLEPLAALEIRDLEQLDQLVDRGKTEFDRYVRHTGRDFLTSYSVTAVALSVFLTRREAIPEHLKAVFPKFAGFVAD